MTTTDAAADQRPWVPDDSSLGARLALLRQAMGWGNVKEAAVACGVPVESWRTWERDNVTPRNLPEIAWRISQATGVDYGWLLDPRTTKRHEPLEPRVVRRGRQASASASAAGRNSYSAASAGRAAAPPPSPAPAGRHVIPHQPIGPASPHGTRSPRPAGRAAAAVAPSHAQRTRRVDRPAA